MKVLISLRFYKLNYLEEQFVYTARTDGIQKCEWVGKEVLFIFQRWPGMVQEATNKWESY
jgi:hypothetical protein